VFFLVGTAILFTKEGREMIWLVLPLVLGLLLLVLSNLWRTRAVERRWERALREQEGWPAAKD
jgi:hypothetical protein